MYKWPKQLLTIIEGCIDLGKRRDLYMAGLSDDDVVDSLKQAASTDLDPFYEVKLENERKRAEQEKRRLEQNEQVKRVYRLQPKERK